MRKILAALILVLALALPSMATVSDTESPVKIYSTGTATEYAIPFDYISDSDIVVTLVNATTGAETAQTLDVDYTIVSDTVTYSSAPGAGYKVVIQRVTPYTQEASFSAGEAPPLTTYESAFDKSIYIAQDLNERLERALLLPETTATKNITWPDLVLNAGKLVRINTDGDGLEAIATVVAGSALDVTAYCDAADLAELHAYQTTSGLTVDDITALHSWVTTSGVSATDLTMLADATSIPAANKVAVRDANSIVKGAELNMTGEVSGVENDGSVNIALTGVKAGDKIMVMAYGYIVLSGATYTSAGLGVSKTGGSSTVDLGFTGRGSTTVYFPMSLTNIAIGDSAYYLNGSCALVADVLTEGDGALTFQLAVNQTGGTATASRIGYRVFFLKKG